jgi:hypothetical protein
MSAPVDSSSVGSRLRRRTPCCQEKSLPLIDNLTPKLLELIESFYSMFNFSIARVPW